VGQWFRRPFFVWGLSVRLSHSFELRTGPLPTRCILWEAGRSAPILRAFMWTSMPIRIRRARCAVSLNDSGRGASNSNRRGLARPYFPGPEMKMEADPKISLHCAGRRGWMFRGPSYPRSGTETVPISENIFPAFRCFSEFTTLSSLARWRCGKSFQTPRFPFLPALLALYSLSSSAVSGSCFGRCLPSLFPSTKAKSHGSASRAKRKATWNNEDIGDNFARLWFGVLFSGSILMLHLCCAA